MSEVKNFPVQINWISVKDALPYKYSVEEVRAWSRSLGVVRAMHHSDGWVRHFGGKRENISDITHWMPAGIRIAEPIPAPSENPVTAYYYREIEAPE